MSPAVLLLLLLLLLLGGVAPAPVVYGPGLVLARVPGEAALLPRPGQRQRGLVLLLVS